MSAMLAFALVLSTQTPSAEAVRPSGGLVSRAEMTVRVVVVDRCAVSTDGAACEGALPVRPVAVDRRPGARTTVTF